MSERMCRKCKGFMKPIQGGVIDTDEKVFGITKSGTKMIWRCVDCNSTLEEKQISIFTEKD